MSKIWREDLSNLHESLDIGKDCTIHSHVWIGELVTIGNRVKIQAFSFIPSGVTLEDDVFIGPHVCFTNDKLPPSKGEFWAETLVKKGAVIGANATMLPGVTIGENSMIGAGSVVTLDVPANEVWFGNPAKFYVNRAHYDKL